MSVAIYVRTASAEQDIQNQVEIAQMAVSNQGLQVNSIFQDVAVSGNMPLKDRGSGSKLVEAIDSGRVTRVYVSKLDRLARDFQELLRTLEYFKSNNVSLVSATEPDFNQHQSIFEQHFAELINEAAAGKRIRKSST